MKIFQLTFAYNPQQCNLEKMHDYIIPQKILEVVFGYQFETPQEDGKFLQLFVLSALMLFSLCHYS